MSNDTTMKNKALVWEFQQKVSSAGIMGVADIVNGYLHQDVVWHGPHPINELKGQGGVFLGFWKPFFRSFPDFERHNDVFFGGVFKGDEWITSMGHYVGTFTEDWLDIPASGKLLTIRFGEFCRVQDGKIVEMYVLFDMLDVMRQVNLWPLKIKLGVEGWWPKPHSYNGLVVRAQDHTESRKTTKLISSWMDEVNHFDSTVASLDLLRHSEYYHPKSLHYVSSGFGASRGIEGLKADYQNPLFKGFSQRKFGNHQTHFADGPFMGASGWESIKGVHIGEFLGIKPTNTQVKVRMMEWWRRSGDLIKESWVMIDMVDLLLQLGVDEFASMHDEQEKDQWL